MTAPHTNFDRRELRNALGAFPTGVTVVTTRASSGAFIGLTANSFNSLSLDPPLVLWSLNDQSPSRAAFEQSSHFAINILAEDQSEISKRFATPTATDRFQGIEITEGAGGVPLIGGCAAYFECQRRSAQIEGDHVLFIGRVVQFRAHERLPLVYFRGRYLSTNNAMP